MNRWLLTFLLLAGLVVIAYPRPHKRFLRYQSHKAAVATVARLGPQLHDSDLIFHTSQSAQSQAIQLATHSPCSHCGILYKNAGQWQVFEAVQPVKLTPLADWVARGQGGHFVVKRLRDADTALTPTDLANLRAAGGAHAGAQLRFVFRLGR